MEKIPIKISWMKKEFDIHEKEEILDLVEKFKSDGFVVYDFFICFLAKQNEFKITRDSKKFKLFTSSLNVTYEISPILINKILDYAIEIKLFTLENGIIYCEKLQECFGKVEQIAIKRQEAGKASAEKRKKEKELGKNNSDYKKNISKTESKDKNEKASWNNNTFNKDDIEGYSDSFDVGIQLHPRDEKDPNYPKLEYNCLNKFPREYLEKAVQDFISLTTSKFNKITEPFAMKNRLERQASEGFMKLIRQGVTHIPALSDHPDSEEPKYDFLNDVRKSCDKVLNTCENPAFYMTNLYNSEIRQIMEMKITKPDCFLRIFGELGTDLDLRYIE